MALNSVPNAGQSLATTRDPIRNNFDNINTQFALDHYEFNSTNNGLHQKVTLPAAAAPGQVAAANVIYSQTSALSGEAELVASKQNGSAAPAVCQTNEFTYASYGVIGETTLPSGIKLKWGSATTAGTGSVTVTFTNAFTTVYAVYATISRVGGSNASGDQDTAVRVYDYDNTKMDIVAYRINTGRTRLATPFTWFAIGI